MKCFNFGFEGERCEGEIPDYVGPDNERYFCPTCNRLVDVGKGFMEEIEKQQTKQEYNE